ncbi:MAG TPA: phosphatase PAP2 family protein [Thermoanaerobaculia bacterium]
MKTVAVLLVASLAATPLLADVSERREADVSESREDDAAVCAAPTASDASAVAAFAEEPTFPEPPRQDPPTQPAPQQEPPPPAPTPPPVQEPPQEPAPPKEPPPTRPSLKPKDFWKDVKIEAKRYLADSYAIATAPLHWDGADWTRFGGAVVIVGGLMLADKTIDREMQQNRSRFTNRVSAATTALGGAWSQNLGIGYLLVGYAAKNWELRETGREVLEAGILSHLLDKYVLKNAFGRERPFESDGETRFHPFSSHDSFPSGHATQAFSLASVVAMRAKGWVVPTIAYTAATLVAFDRVNDRVHFASDVVAGAILGTAIGRFIVSRHRSAQSQNQKPAAEFDLVPIRGGLAARVAF